MSEINSGRFNRWIQKLFYIQSGGPASLYQVDSSIQPVLRYQSGPEERYLQGWDQFAVGAAVAAVAANQSGFRLRNPPGSGVVGWIFKLNANVNPASAINLTISNTITVDLANSMTGNKLDRRIIRGNSALILSNQNNAPAITTGSTIATSSPLANVLIEFLVDEIQTMTLLPGDSLDIIANTVNTALGLTCWWMERPLETSELT